MSVSLYLQTDKRSSPIPNFLVMNPILMNWIGEAIKSRKWGRNQSDNDKMRRKMAEFLVKDYVQ